ncbi:hypothetical protein [Gracilimonas sp.]|uniref:hypothetical protein n=1 Tax=Gracilimonas sp. TaxID=1974203 RepID=UPI003BAB158B
MSYSKALSAAFLAIILCVCSAAPSFAQADTETADVKPTQQETLKLVEVRFVCLMTDRSFDEEQIPVNIDGIIYYGCCNNCVKNLKEQEENRYAVDPVSKKRINKATAVIGASADNSVYYFESEENLKRFDPEKHLTIK